MGQNEERDERKRKKRILIERMGVQKRGFGVKTSERLYKAILRPKMEYGVEVWGTEGVEELEVIQRKAARRVLGVGIHTLMSLWNRSWMGENERQSQKSETASLGENHKNARR